MAEHEGLTPEEREWIAVTILDATAERDTDAAARLIEARVWSLIAARTTAARAEGAAAVVAKVEALAEEWDQRGEYGDASLTQGARRLRAVLRDVTGEQAGETRGEVGTGAGEGATGQDTGTAWVTRSMDCPEAPAQAHLPTAPEGVTSGEADAWRDREGVIWLNLRKHPDGWPGAYDPDSTVTPLHLAAQPVEGDASGEVGDRG